ncbi:MAG: hypothetical protein HND43_03835 [Armatimonadetes bacterium]|nr:hypothetical protein [Armatimonadota bacterium]GIK32121.1 MAG: hypothetical protein BroJett009_11130 [Armatimonadota bacterium]
MKFLIRGSLISGLGTAIAASGFAVQIVGLSIPVNSMDSSCRPRNEGVWSVSGTPAPDNSGIGYWVNPSSPGPGDFVLHDHVYVGSNIPDPSRAVVTYEFDSSVTVQSIDIVEHANGITRIEGFTGDSLGSMTSVGNVFGSAGDVTGSAVLTELSTNHFDFTSPISGKFFQMVVTKTSHVDGYAAYRGYVTAVPEPSTAVAALTAISCFRLRKRHRAVSQA